MPLGPRYGRMEQPPTEEEQAATRRRERKVDLVAKAIKEHQLSWQIKTRYGEDVWPILTYDLQWREGMPGAIIMVDRDTDMDMKIYAPGTWFSVESWAFVDGEWTVFQPQPVYLVDLADRLIAEEASKDMPE